MMSYASNKNVAGATISFIINVLALVLIAVVSMTYSKEKQQPLDQEAGMQRQIQTDFESGMISGEFKSVSGDCTPYCIISVSGDDLLLEGIDYSGSSTVRYSESYIRSSSDKYTFCFPNYPQVQIKVYNSNEFYFSNPGYRNCKFIKTRDR